MIDRERFFNVMGSLGVRGAVLDKPLDTLSAGELKKIELARTLVTPADVLVWDEPLNAVDLESREQLEALVTDAMCRLALTGTPRQVIAQIENLVALGITQVNLGGPLGPDPAEAIRLMGERVIPYFRS